MSSIILSEYDMKRHLLIGKRIASIRSMLRLTQTKFAASIGISRSFLSELESGKTKPGMPILLAIEYKFGYRHEWIEVGEEPIHVYNSPVQRPIDITPLSEHEVSNRVLFFWTAVFNRIFEEGDKKKIDLLKAQLRALDPGMKKIGPG